MLVLKNECDDKLNEFKDWMLNPADIVIVTILLSCKRAIRGLYIEIASASLVRNNPFYDSPMIKVLSRDAPTMTSGEEESITQIANEPFTSLNASATHSVNDKSE